MEITTTESWQRKQVELNGVPVAVITTDDLVFHKYPIWEALTTQEKLAILLKFNFSTTENM